MSSERGQARFKLGPPAATPSRSTLPEQDDTQAPSGPHGATATEPRTGGRPSGRMLGVLTGVAMAAVIAVGWVVGPPAGDQELSAFAPPPEPAGLRIDTVDLLLTGLPDRVTIRGGDTSGLGLSQGACDMTVKGVTNGAREVQVSCIEYSPMHGDAVIVVPSEVNLHLTGGRWIRVEGSLTSVTVASSTADVELGLDRGDVDLDIDGDVWGSVGEASSVQAHSRHGRISVNLRHLVESTTLGADRGDVAVGVPPGRVDLDLDAEPSGRVMQEVPDTQGAGARVKVRAPGGVIVVRRAGEG